MNMHPDEYGGKGGARLLNHLKYVKCTCCEGLTMKHAISEGDAGAFVNSYLHR